MKGLLTGRASAFFLLPFRGLARHNVTLHQEEGKKRPKRVGFAEEEHQQYLQQQQDMADE